MKLQASGGIQLALCPGSHAVNRVVIDGLSMRIQPMAAKRELDEPQAVANCGKGRH
jgi:hypothetical protein